MSITVSGVYTGGNSASLHFHNLWAQLTVKNLLWSTLGSVIAEVCRVAHCLVCVGSFLLLILVRRRTQTVCSSKMTSASRPQPYNLSTAATHGGMENTVDEIRQAPVEASAVSASSAPQTILPSQGNLNELRNSVMEIIKDVPLSLLLH